MKANVLRDALGNITVYINGDLDYEYAIPFKKELEMMSTNNPNAKINIDIGAVDFVGSSGICHFVETIHLLNTHKKEHNCISVSNATDEFKRLFNLYTPEGQDPFWDAFEMGSDETQDMSISFAGRKRTFEN